MSLLIPKPSARRAYLGADSVWYCENSAGHVFLTSPASPVPEGYIRAQAQTVWEVERVWARLDQQERRAVGALNEAAFRQRAARLAQARSGLQSRLTAADVTNAERAFVRAALAVLARKEAILQRNSVYGIAAMQTTEAPLPGAATKVKVN